MSSFSLECNNSSRLVGQWRGMGGVIVVESLTHLVGQEQSIVVGYGIGSLIVGHRGTIVDVEIQQGII